MSPRSGAVRRRKLSTARILLGSTALLVGCIARTSADGTTASDGDAFWSVVVAEWHGAAALSRQRDAACLPLSPSPSCDASAAAAENATRPPSSTALAALAAAASATARSARTPDALRRLALLDASAAGTDLTVWTRVVDRLDEAAAMRDAPADLLVDNVAVHLQRFAVAHRLTDLLVALDRSTPAVTRLPGSWQACHNRTLALRWAGLAFLAAREHARCVTLRGAHRTSMQQAVAGSYESAADSAWRILLPRWAQHVLAGRRDEARGALASVRPMAIALERAGVDSGLARTLERIDRAPARDGLTTLAHAFRLYAAMHAPDVERSTVRVQALIDSTTRLVGPQDPLAALIALEQAVVTVRTGKLAQARGEYARLLQPEFSAIVRTRATRGRAATLGALGSPLDALRGFDDAERTCRSLRLGECALAAPAMSAQMTAGAGDLVETEVRALRAIGSLGAATLNSWHWSTMYLLRNLAARAGAVHATQSLDDEALLIADSLHRPDLGAQTLIASVQSLIGRDSLDAADRVLRELEARWLPQLTDADRQFVATSVLLFRGTLRRRTDPVGGAALLDSALLLTGPNENEMRRLPIRLARAAAHLQLGDTATMLGELDDVLERLRALDGTQASIFSQARLAAVRQEAAELTARVRRARGDALGALRALSAWRDGSSPAAGCCGSGPGVTLAVRLVRDSLWIWQLGAGGAALRLAAVDRAMIAQLTALDTTALANAYDRIVAPVLDGAPPALLCIDARGLPARVPWSALRSRSRRAWLVELVPIQLVSDGRVPCATAPAPTTPRMVQLVAGATDAGSRGLRGAVREVDTLTTIWRDAHATVLRDTTGARAVLQHAAASDVVHFAGHAILDSERPERSYLLVRAREDSVVRSAEIARQRYRRRPIVILAACETGASGTGIGSGFDSLAGAFLAAGARSVIASGWPVDDAPTARLMAAVHRALRNGHSPAVSLQEAQQLALRSGDPTLATPRVWAAFQVLGSGREMP